MAAVGFKNRCRDPLTFYWKKLWMMLMTVLAFLCCFWPVFGSTIVGRRKLVAF
jgi:hypothetical protein